MKKIILLICLLIGVNLFAGLVDDGFRAEQSCNYKKAIKIYTKACENGVASGCNYLGGFYARGEGLKQDYKKANELYTKACDSGNAAGCYQQNMCGRAGTVKKTL